MENNVRIVFKSGIGELDVNTDIGFGLTYAIDDIRKPESRNSSFSKTISLPSTNNNNRLLGLLFDISATFDNFNVNTKTPAYIIVNDVVVLDGFLQLRNINKSLKYNDNGDSFEYDVVMYETVNDIFSDMGDKDIGNNEDYNDNLDLSEFDHTLTYENITNSWVGSSADGYMYPQMYTGRQYGQVVTSDFKPAVYHKTYLTKIAEKYGYSLSGSFLTNTHYNQEVVPYNGAMTGISESVINTRKFRAGRTADYTAFTSATSDAAYGCNNLTGCDGQDYKLMASPDGFIYNDDSTSPNFDNGGSWDTTLGSWTAIANGRYNLDIDSAFRLDFSINDPSALAASAQGELYCKYLNSGLARNSSGWLNQSTATFELGVSPYISVYVNGTLISERSLGSQIALPEIITTGTTESITFQKQISNILSNRLLHVGDEVTVKARFSTSKKFLYAEGQFGTPPGITDARVVDIDVIALKSGTTFECGIYNEPIGGLLTDGDDVLLNDFLVKDMKQKDIFNDIIQRYNIFLQVDPNDENVINLTTRENFYAETTEVLDWSNKLDHDSEVKIEFVPELSNKEFLFSYTEADDDANEAYSASANGEIYGQRKVVFTNEFAKGQKEIESPFSPTINGWDYGSQAGSSSRKIVPMIDAEKPDCNPRVLYFGGLINTSWIGDTTNQAAGTVYNYNFTWVDSGGTSTVEVLNQYPYCGMDDNPMNPTVSIKYGPTAGETYWQAQQTITDNDLYNRFWKNYIEELDDGRLMTAKFYLTEVDIANVKNNLNKRIFINNNYYYINKINDYDPTKNVLTEVELLKIQP